MKTPTKAQQLAFIRSKITTNNLWAEKALIRIFDAQTESEKQVASTTHFNGVGFTHADASFLTGCARTVLSRGHLTEKQLPYVYKKIGKYARQLMNSSYFEEDKLIKLMLK